MKDNTNILPINPWSGGEYSGHADIDLSDRGGLIQITNNNSYIGEKSIRVKGNQIVDGFNRYWVYIIFNGELNKTYECRINIYNPNNPCYFELKGSDKHPISNVTIPSLNKWQEIILSGTLSNADDPYIRIKTDGVPTSYFFTDNLRIHEIQ